MVCFGYLIVDRRPADRVRFPDGAVELHPTGHGPQVAEAWNAARVSDDGSGPAEPSEQEVQQKLQELLTAWEARLAELERDASSFGSPESRRASFVRRNPRPTEDDAWEALRGPTPRRARRSAADTARADSLDGCWWATLESDAGGFAIPVEGPGPVPRDAIARLLSRLSEDGWDVRHVSEERTAVHGPSESRAICIGMNVMLSRPSTA